ncbi:MAG: hypothetical protein L0338_13710 [Acidobacteria bacterium]|nr:hypothetical protein [Acidobacteriota bacterium]
MLGGEEPYQGLQTVLPLLVQVHAKDISIQRAAHERRKVTGTPVGCACGEGVVVDWDHQVHTLGGAGWSGVLSVECGTRNRRPIASITCPACWPVCQSRRSPLWFEHR